MDPYAGEYPLMDPHEDNPERIDPAPWRRCSCHYVRYTGPRSAAERTNPHERPRCPHCGYRFHAPRQGGEVKP